jgi:hypothetical protein
MIEDINRAWENTISKLWLNRVLSLYELQQDKPRVDEEYLRFFDQRKQAKLQWVQDQNQSNIISTMEDLKLVDISGTKRRNI